MHEMCDHFIYILYSRSSKDLLLVRQVVKFFVKSTLLLREYKNKRTLDAGRRQEKLANHKPDTSDLHAFLRVSSQLLAKNVVYC